MLNLKVIKNSELVTVTVYKPLGRDLYRLDNVPVEKVIDKLKRKSDQGIVKSALRYADKQFQSGDKFNILYLDRKKVGVEILFDPLRHSMESA